MVNIVEIELAMEATRTADEKSLWRQDEWIVQLDCGTAGCFAGNYALAKGCKPPRYIWDDGSSAYVVTPDGETVLTSAYAQEGMGLSKEEADVLFHSENTLDDLERLVMVLVDGGRFSE